MAQGVRVEGEDLDILAVLIWRALFDLTENQTMRNMDCYKINVLNVKPSLIRRRRRTHVWVEALLEDKKVNDDRACVIIPIYEDKVHCDLQRVIYRPTY